jgi:hypothetical protein
LPYTRVAEIGGDDTIAAYALAKYHPLYDSYPSELGSSSYDSDLQWM